MFRITLNLLSLVLFVSMLSACSTARPPLPGPDKQAIGTFYGAAAGAGAGAITGTQLGSGAGPGAWVGAGLGAAYGAATGIGLDGIEKDQYERYQETRRLREELWVQEILSEHYNRRAELHPNREIFPADLFFESDSTKFRRGAGAIARGIAKLTKERLPWSRIVVATYVTSDDKESSFATHLTRSRAEKLASALVRAGIEPRRLVARPIVVDQPVLVDPYDEPDRYYQAIELIYEDR